MYKKVMEGAISKPRIPEKPAALLVILQERLKQMRRRSSQHEDVPFRSEVRKELRARMNDTCLQCSLVHLSRDNLSHVWLCEKSKLSKGTLEVVEKYWTMTRKHPRGKGARGARGRESDPRASTWSTFLSSEADKRRLYASTYLQSMRPSTSEGRENSATRH